MMRYVLLLIGLLGLGIFPCFALFAAMNMSENQLEKATAIARKSLGDLPGLVRQIDAKTLGFDDPKQVGAATLGTPLGDYMVRLDELKEYRAGQTATELLHATGRLIYPLVVNQSPKSALILKPGPEGWALESFGSANQIRMVTELRKKLAQREGQAEKALFQVRIPALQLLFVGVERNGVIGLAPLFDMPTYGLKKGEVYPAAQVLEKLVEAARNHNGEPS